MKREVKPPRIMYATWGLSMASWSQAMTACQTDASHLQPLPACLLSVVNLADPSLEHYLVGLDRAKDQVPALPPNSPNALRHIYRLSSATEHRRVRSWYSRILSSLTRVEIDGNERIPNDEGGGRGERRKDLRWPGESTTRMANLPERITVR